MAKLNRTLFFNHWLGRTRSSRPFSQGEVVRFLFDLAQMQLLYHMEDAASTVPCFTGEEANWLDNSIVPRLKAAFLVNYGGDINQVALACLNYDSKNGYSAHPPAFIHPKWGVAEEEADDPNEYFCYLRPEKWNGWARPLFDRIMMSTLLVNRGMKAQYHSAPLIPGFFRVTDDDGTTTDLLPRKIWTTDGVVSVYEMDGLCFDAGDCLEMFPLHWRGYV